LTYYIYTDVSILDVDLLQCTEIFLTIQIDITLSVKVVTWMDNIE